MSRSVLSNWRLATHRSRIFERVPDNHHRYKSGKRKGQAPLELLTGKPLQAEWWELLIQQVKKEADAKDLVDLPSTPPLHLRDANDGRTDQPARSAGQANWEHTAASENDPGIRRDSKAA